MNRPRWYMALTVKQADVLVGALSRYLDWCSKNTDEHAIAFLMKEDIEHAIRNGEFQ